MRNGQGNQQKSSGKVFKSIPLLHVYLQESGPSTFLYQRKVYFINDLTPKLVTDIKGKQTSKQTKVNPQKLQEEMHTKVLQEMTVTQWFQALHFALGTVKVNTKLNKQVRKASIAVPSVFLLMATTSQSCPLETGAWVCSFKGRTIYGG